MKVKFKVLLYEVEIEVQHYELFLLETVRDRNNPNAKLKTVSMETKEILSELERDYKPVENSGETSKPKADRFNAAHFSTGAVAAGFTSTVMPLETIHEAAIVSEDLVRWERVKKKGKRRLFKPIDPT